MQKYFIRGFAVGAALVVGSLSGALLGQAPVGQAPVGQTPDVAPAFEVATIRPVAPMQDALQQLMSGKARIGMSVDGARVNIGYQSLADLIRIAYRVKAYQVQGPEWMSQQRFEIQAKIPDGVAEDKIPEMLQALLAERFKLAIHRDKKDLAVFALIVGKNGSKLVEASSEPEAPLPDSPGAIRIGSEKGPMKVVQDGKGGAVMQGAGQAGTIRQSISDTGVHLELTKTSIATLVDLLTAMVDRPVLDMTELKGNYQISLDLPMEDLQLLARRNAAALGIQMPGPPPGANSADAASTPGGGSTVFAAMEKLGLKLDARKAPVETIVVDHVEKAPTDN
jgi:uncharacterized protein (TIGR03435 family)